MGLKIKGTCLVAFVAVLGYLYRDTFDPESLANVRVLVTGASTGIGEEIAYHYARAGAQIVLTARRENILIKVRSKCLELGAKSVSLVVADMGVPEDREKVMEKTITDLGGLDYLVLNHIGYTPFQMWDGDVNHTRWLMEVNFLSYIHLAAKALPYLTKSHGSVIVLSSLAGKIATPYTTSYGATKFALDGFFGSLRHELAMKRIPVSITLCILGLINTQSAMEKVKDKIAMPAYPAHDAALAVVSAGTSRIEEMYYPWYVRPLCFIRDWFPQSRAWFMQKSYQYKAEETSTPS
ncbi:hydroxysteroid 11-beta-dehydrogenase 1-like protein [Hyla sarda]|uniref:hydroxysteroid 11-beta-dehydrogenase 1-like protein n=1 Tax=Hyla sarda TaxID=327740 RepID=UPI0024C3D2B0|nr:hydroxysteroid 11-beta-dehydrogenase 1-like protein [Hyla sarda]XP_056374048.1 hydroxysteroid 11-beta-dehydrogenase 1-like protein [Hyla sarda]XP_056374049.1 hydroxysteroid 11-beta-dehydrogenase 1-like protein [Hyla sarda]XP_056374050.1 hydroxysteroid 11-beta-dehydrogenase 1-like protein [Hyla sarda]XP_056374051.1 hydroxysteroid 11-beta-dehydrogenase 1-like protein [Hyla sarda]XP_056374052.1 hydroxysteroid 11-beta-dehydrogenase 1-like protein [Hyla sarda]